jgi:hypothetical protein
MEKDETVQGKDEHIKLMQLKKQREEAAEKVRNEGLYNKDKEQAEGGEIDLEIEAPGSANAVAEEGSLVI